MTDPNDSSMEQVAQQPRRRPSTTRAADGRVPPHDLDAEEAAIGAALLSTEAARRLVELVQPGDFYRPAHQHIAQAVAALVAMGERPDLVTVSIELGELLDDCGGRQYLLELQNATPAISNIARYAQRVADTAAARRMIGTAAEIADLGYHADRDPDTALVKAGELFARLTANANPIDRFAGRVLDLEALRLLEPPSPLIPGLLDVDSLAVLYGPPGVGKSFVALDMALRVATGTRWHGHQLITAGAVLYIAGEGANGLADRIDAWKERTHTFADPTNLAVVPAAANLLDPAEVADLYRYITRTRPTLVVVDTLARCTPGADENSSRDMGLAIAALDAIRTAGGSCVLAVHHSGKSLEAGLRGHSSLLGALDTVLRLTGTEHVLQLDQEKQKHHPEGNRQTYRLTPAGRSAAIEPYTSAASDSLTGKTLAALRVLSEIEQPAGITFSRWRTAAAPDIAEATLARALKTLRSSALIGLHAESTEKSPRYVLTDAGRSHIDDPTETGQEQA